jgi:hypothetical protein
LAHNLASRSRAENEALFSQKFLLRANFRRLYASKWRGYESIHYAATILREPTQHRKHADRSLIAPNRPVNGSFLAGLTHIGPFWRIFQYERLSFDKPSETKRQDRERFKKEDQMKRL